ncbi:MAG: cytochrome-c peroxidase [Verrucomicrobiaceae bacterium]|nr:cytochrome-c peroxidase [Verrucomicrobiaceae bacterium]
MKPDNRLRHFVFALGIAVAPTVASAAELADAFLPLFQPLPAEKPAPDNELTEEKIALGRMLYYDKRFSKNHDISCNSCHSLSDYGTDRSPNSSGHKGQRGGRSAPSVYNAALHIAQFWDGRAPSVEEQAKGPPLNPIEMAMAGKDAVETVLKSIPGYVDAFKKAFPNEANPVSYDNFGKAIGAFERKLMTPSRWDKYLKGDKSALTDEEKKGFETYASVGCANCHNGVAVGGMLYQKLGLVKAWPDLKDLGRYEATKKEEDKYFFKVPSLRNIGETGPYLHDGSVKDLPGMVNMMAEHQLGKTLSEDQTKSIISFLSCLKGEIPADYIKEPELPASGPDTPKPDPT